MLWEHRAGPTPFGLNTGFGDLSLNMVKSWDCMILTQRNLKDKSRDKKNTSNNRSQQTRREKQLEDVKVAKQREKFWKLAID